MYSLWWLCEYFFFFFFGERHPRRSTLSWSCMLAFGQETQSTANLEVFALELRAKELYCTSNAEATDWQRNQTYRKGLLIVTQLFETVSSPIPGPHVRLSWKSRVAFQPRHFWRINGLYFWVDIGCHTLSEDGSIYQQPFSGHALFPSPLVWRLHDRLQASEYRGCHQSWIITAGCMYILASFIINLV